MFYIDTFVYSREYVKLTFFDLNFKRNKKSVY